MPSKSIQETIKIRPILKSDYQQVYELQSRYNMSPKTEEDWTHLHFNNVYAEEYKNYFKEELIPGWVVCKETQIVGCLFNILSKYTYLHKEYFAVTAHSYLVIPEFRNQSLPLLLNFLKQKKPHLILNTTTNQDVSDIFVKLKFNKSMTPDYDISLFWILNYSGFLKSLLLFKKLHFISFSAILLQPLDYLLNILRTGINDPSIIELSDFDQRFDDLWNDLINTKDFLAFRDLKSLQWHFKEKINNQSVKIICKLNLNKIKSYALFIEENNKLFNLKRLRLVDYVDTTNNPENLHKIMKYVLNDPKNKVYSMIEAVGMNSNIRNVLLSLRPYTRKLPAWMFYFKPNHTDLNDLKFAQHWNCNSFDGDGSL